MSTWGGVTGTHIAVQIVGRPDAEHWGTVLTDGEQAQIRVDGQLAWGVAHRDTAPDDPDRDRVEILDGTLKQSFVDSLSAQLMARLTRVWGHDPAATVLMAQVRAQVQRIFGCTCRNPQRSRRGCAEDPTCPVHGSIEAPAVADDGTETARNAS